MDSVLAAIKGTCHDWRMACSERDLFTGSLLSVSVAALTWHQSISLISTSSIAEDRACYEHFDTLHCKTPIVSASISM